MDWLPGVERFVTGTSGGSYVGGPFRIVLHRTEGSSIEGAVSAYRAKNVAPHLTVDLKRRRIAQHTPFTVASRALQNLPGGVETNRRSTLQIEIVGFSADSKLDADADVQWFGVAVLRPLMQAFGVKPVYPTFYGPGCGWVLASVSARQRMSGAAWNAFNGVCAHQHVPEQSHWDSGEFKIGVALAAANPQKDWLEDLLASLTDDEKGRFMRFVDNYNRTWDEKQPSKVDGTPIWLAEAAMFQEANVSKMVGLLERLAAKLGA